MDRGDQFETFQAKRFYVHGIRLPCGGGIPQALFLRLLYRLMLHDPTQPLLEAGFVVVAFDGGGSLLESVYL